MGARRFGIKAVSGVRTIVAITLLTVCVLALAKLIRRETVRLQIVILNKNIAQSSFLHFISKGLICESFDRTI